MFIENIEEYEFKNQEAIKSLNKYLWSIFHKFKPLVNKCEYEDLRQDIILCVIESDRTYDSKYETKFSTYLGYGIMSMFQDVITRYKGIKLWNCDKYTLEKQTGEKIYINITNLEEEV